MMLESPAPDAFRDIPDGYTARLYRRDELGIRKRVAADEAYVNYVDDYYNRVHAKNEDDFFAVVYLSVTTMTYPWPPALFGNHTA